MELIDIGRVIEINDSSLNVLLQMKLNKLNFSSKINNSIKDMYNEVVELKNNALNNGKEHNELNTYINKI